MKGKILYNKALKEASSENPNNKLVLDLLKKSIKLGNPNATYSLGTWYLHGKFVDKDFQKAFDLLSKAAENNVPEACFDLAVSCESGKGIKKNEQKAFEYYMTAALWGNKQSYYEVGRCYYYGIGIPMNKKVANIWFEKAESIGITS